MKRKLLIFTIILLFINVVNGQTLSKEQKLEDFEYLYQILKNNYPYFGVLEREHNIKWLEYKSDFIKAIEETKNDKEFAETILDILRNLRSGHTDLSPSYRRNTLIAMYKDANRKKWLDNLEKGNDYWSNLFGFEDKKIVNEQEFPYDSTLLDCFVIDQDNIAVIKIKSFNSFQIYKDVKRIKKFLKKIEDYPYLIIDIQDNGGGNSRYWSDNIVPLLTKKNIVFKNYYAIRNSEYVKSYFEDLKWEKEKFKKIQKLPNLPSELNEKDFYFTSDIDTIIAKQKTAFKGKISLLVNSGVYSSAEGFAVFSKATKWATVVGQMTAGDGVGIDPIITILPNSRILFRFPGEMGLNPDGSSNEEMNTIPEIEIAGRSSEERLYNYAKTINSDIEYVYHDVPVVLNDCKADILIYPTNESSDSLNIKIKQQVDWINSKFFHTPDSLYMPDTIALKKDLSNYNITCYGSINGNLWIKKNINELPLKITSDYIKTDKTIKGNNLRLITSWFNNKSEGYYVRFYTSQKSEGVLNINAIRNGGTNYVIGNGNYEVLEKGNYFYKNGKYQAKPSR